MEGKDKEEEGATEEDKEIVRLFEISSDQNEIFQKYPRTLWDSSLIFGSSLRTSKFLVIQRSVLEF